MKPSLTVSCAIAGITTCNINVLAPHFHLSYAPGPCAVTPFMYIGFVPVMPAGILPRPYFPRFSSVYYGLSSRLHWPADLISIMLDPY